MLAASIACGSNPPAAPAPVVTPPTPPAPIPAGTVSPLSGDGQTGNTKAALAQPLVVKVTDLTGAPMAGFAVTWSSATSTFANQVTPTAADGTASATATLGAVPGIHSFTASAAGLSGSPVTFSATAVGPTAVPVTCNAAPAILASSTVACGLYSPCPTAKPACTKPIATSTVGPGVQEIIALGPHTVGDLVSFVVPTGTTSFTILEQARQAPDVPAASVAPDTVTFSTASGPITIQNTALPDELHDPGGNLLFNDFVAPPNDPSNVNVFYASSSPVTGAFTVPNTSPMLQQASQGLPAGNWNFLVNDLGFECTKAANCTGGKSATSTYDVSVLLKSGTAPTSGVLDVAFYLVGEPALTAATAPADLGVQRMVKTLAGIYANAGICLGKVTFFDIPSWAQVAYGSNLNADDESPCGDLNQMFTLSAPGSQLNFFLVNSLIAKSFGGATVVGVDGTIPGPSAFGGTVHSGAAVNGADLESNARCGTGLTISNSCGADVVAYIAAHEGGHWLGLYHTTEFDGEAFDPVADSAKCPCEACAPAADRANCNNSNSSLRTTMDGPSCTTPNAVCGGGDDLMFWLLSNTSRGTLTPEQAALIRRNPVVQ